MLARLLRSRRFWLAAVPLGALGLYLAIFVFGVQALFYDVEVNEEFPTSSRAAAPMQVQAVQPTAAPTAVPTSAPTSTPATAAPRAPAATATPAPTAIPTALPTATPIPTPEGPVLATAGQFHDVVHYGSGDALIYRQPDGTYLLRLENLDVDNGPDLYVYAVAAPDSYDTSTVFDAGFLNLGMLKGNKGNQNYALPAEFDPAVHRSITVWCQRFSVNFATAPLQ